MAKTILFIEDEDAIIMMYEVKFTAHHITFLAATDGASGIKLAKTKKPDIIMLDIKLPDMDGIEVLKALKADAKTKKIPVWLFSNSYQKEYETKGKEFGAEVFIPKTKYLPDKFVKLVEHRLDK